MRAKEFITETKPMGKIKKGAAKASHGILTMRDVGGYDRTYHLNRIMMATAMSDGTTKPVDMDSASWYEKYNTAHPYTKEEYNMMIAAFNTIPSDDYVDVPFSKSEELDNINKVSPVSNWMKDNEK